jgi:predicted acetyltransferase
LSVEIRLLTQDDDLGQELDLTRRAFGPFGDSDQERRLARLLPAIRAGRHLAAFDGTAMVASAWYFDMRQWWYGRPLPMAGVAGVKVAPEERGRGVGRALMAGLLEQIASRGYPLSVLYPATSAVYRSLGWEIAGGEYQVTMPSRSLRSLLPPDPLAGPPEAAGPAIRRAGPGDAAEIIACRGELHAAARDGGPVSFDAPAVASQLADPNTFCYLAPDGLLIYQWNRPADEILVLVLAAGSASTTRALWSIVASHGTMAGHVRANLSPADPVSWLVPEPDVALSRRYTWMLRLADAQAAIAGRGFPDGAELVVPLSVQDAQLPANDGGWLLEVSGGKGTLTRRETGPPGPGRIAAPLGLGARGLAAMYAGTPLATLRRAGLAAGGDPAADAPLDEAFAATPYMFDYF